MTHLIAGARLSKALSTDEKRLTVELLHNQQIDVNFPRRVTEIFRTKNHELQPLCGLCYSLGQHLSQQKTAIDLHQRKWENQRCQLSIASFTEQSRALEQFGGEGFTLQQDWAPAHSTWSMSSIYLKLLRGSWGKDIWPSNSLVLKSMDYSVRLILKATVSAHRHTTEDAFEMALTRFGTKLWWKRVRASLRISASDIVNV
ncbi:hypothetical protein KIN20_028316 [Parelaphostrongylus tenuis]|uniref:Uncharacterized protein n=1 Tax=Parelaphostrongylus tenuis TaxID=148309 RepID=A0AAD5R0S9_PARTN|nr:hypothetical protein KIN20_028316 [Parelaphostrongylus tenuis]